MNYPIHCFITLLSITGQTLELQIAQLKQLYFPQLDEALMLEVHAVYTARLVALVNRHQGRVPRSELMALYRLYLGDFFRAAFLEAKHEEDLLLKQDIQKALQALFSA